MPHFTRAEIERLRAEATFELVTTPAIRCLRCGFVSSNALDVERRWCPRCRLTHLVPDSLAHPRDNGGSDGVAQG